MPPKNIAEKEPSLAIFLVISLLIHLVLFKLLAWRVVNLSSEAEGNPVSLSLKISNPVSNPVASLSPPRVPLPAKAPFSRIKIVQPEGSKPVFPVSDFGPVDSTAEPLPIRVTEVSKDNFSSLPSLPPGAPREKGNKVLRTGYLSRVIALIDRAKRYPLRARLAGYQGDVKVSFVIEADGRVQAVRVVRSSGYALLDKAAQKTIWRAAPFPPPPRELSPPLELTVKISFVLQENH